ncbi:Glycosyltransferase involved in cell wall bisynthesis [Virgibacillus subterraneus]|uniref:Glycosyltransferase involved in cell wall bisynthesis n=1 Tax=Virgibacillus subterraneus TaxID=621109 RepID=A0A1H8ZSC5_9BACI|nr:glycosyltransferase [Virgibacillus subterraneus]SEP67390.1 Glycosyltransferase involved in cell wall bisynthesis [Virgibacillus subterraneus]
MKQPDISIIVPIYNSSQYISKCIESIMAQTFRNFELILVNDGSTDHSGQICDQYAEKDSRIIVIHKKNGGVSSARNTGINIAKGEYISFVDGDDWIYSDMYYRLYELCKETDSDISICGNYREVNGDVIHVEREKLVIEMDNTEAMRQLFTGKYFRFAVWAKLYKKSCFENIQYPEDRRLDDLPTTYKIFTNANKVVYTSYAGYVYLLRENSILTSSYNEKKLDVFIGWDEIIAFMNENYPQLSKEYISCFVYYSMDHVYSILNQVKDPAEKEKYILYIQKFIRKYYKEILKNARLSLKYKYLTTLINYNVRFLFLNNKIKRTVTRQL